MNPRLLTQFLALADNLHFGRASLESHVSISALSRNIKSLEQAVGVSLFHRDNRSVGLTREGQKFQIYARETLANWKAIQYELSDNSEQLKGEISVYCSVTAAYTILFDLMNRFRSGFPGIDIKLHTGNPDYAINRIIDGKEDITIAAHPNTLPRGVVFKPITISPLLFITSIDRNETQDDDWLNEPMIMSEGGLARQRVDAFFKEMNIMPKVYAQVAGFEAIVSMVSLGLGVGVVPKIVLDNSPMADRVRVLKVKQALKAYNIGLFTLKKNLKNPMVKAFWELV
ncbi:MAG: HTH-type transcriptional activator IlvY [Gammaproteobacteria bacterium]|nr:HTH-type transcriptional activator IlvY [Gammaproteobacteria bacterium]NNC97762.1 HTH-type transcriptional activator IlvY [Gammaproteobacteria bacterium]NNM13929.1 HTH-type transcriptional activator IlvY [Gammaproteobacteria bacterium]